MEIDRMRIAAASALEALGYIYEGGRWLPETTKATPLIHLTVEADAMHATLVRRADALASCIKGPEEAFELRTTCAVLDAYEAKRWPLGKEPGGKG
jgi:hypothetical protein